MIDSPDLDQFVFCRVVETVQIDVRGELSVLNEDFTNDEDEFGDNIQEHVAGSYLIAMYKLIRDLVLDGKVELLMWSFSHRRAQRGVSDECGKPIHDVR